MDEVQVDPEDLDAYPAFELACTLERRPQLQRMALVQAVAIPVVAVLIWTTRRDLVAQAWMVGLVAEVVVIGHVLMLARASSHRHVVLAHTWIHVGLVSAVAYLGVHADILAFHTSMMTLFIWGPLTSLTLSRRVTVASFGFVPLALVGAWWLHPHVHSFDAIVRAVFVVGLSAALGIVLMEHKRRAEWEAFVSRRELDRANRELAASMQRLVRTQGELVRSEKLAVLGQLVAGVAHELNTPMGAIKASASTLTGGLPASLLDLPGALADMDEVERTLFLALLERAMAAPTGAVAVSSRDERSLRRRLARTLRSRGIDDAHEQAEVLSELGAGGDLDTLLPLLQHPGAGAVLARVDAIAALRRSAGTIELAAGRASKIVQALKRYAHPGDAAGNAVRASLADNIDTVLTLYGNHLKQGVEVVREYGDRGDVEAHHEALNQVWTNLVHNALQAMDGQGRLTVRVLPVGDAKVRVEVEDDGPGIPEDVRARIFEPFYTTKGAGEGSGLGLSICKDIVEQHGGRIGLSSKPGCTRFSVTLPRVASG